MKQGHILYRNSNVLHGRKNCITRNANDQHKANNAAGDNGEELGNIHIHEQKSNSVSQKVGWKPNRTLPMFLKKGDIQK